MSRISMARAIIVIPAALILAVTISAGARAALRAGVGGGGLATAMLATGDLPAGSQPDASLTGPLTGERAQALGIDPSQLGSHDALVHAWLSPHRAEEVVETGADTWTRDDAQAGVAASASDLLKQGAVRQSLPGPARLDGYGGFVQGNGTRLFLLVLPLARGPYLFVLRVYTAASSAGSAGGLMSAVAAAAMRKVPADTPDTVSPGTFAADVARGAVGVLFAYLLMVDGIAYGRNPLRRKRGQGRSTRPQAGPGIIDVSAAAKKSKRTAVWRLAVQFIGLSLAAYGADAVGVHFWYAYLVAGLAIIWAGGWFIRPAGARRDHHRAILAGTHQVPVTGMLTVAATMILLGLAGAVFAGLYLAFPQGSTVLLAPGRAPTPAQNVGGALTAGAFVLIALGATVFRGARRLGSIRARELTLRDPRPPVLYLRSFGNDRLKLWTAALGRPSLIERFTLRRFDTFEEVLVRYLSGYGPVIAVNPPGTRLAPLSAARETIDSADWQATVATWMVRSRLIVFAAPPSQVNEGLQWELEAVSVYGYWDKALIVVPPVRAEKLQDRWRELVGVGLWPGPVPGPVEDPHALVVALRNGRWQVISADRRTEWSYSAALERALGDPRRLAAHPTQQAHRPAAARPAAARPAGRRWPVPLPIAALVVLLGAAVGAAGAWYAAGKAPAAYQSAIAPASSPPLRRPLRRRPASPPPAAHRRRLRLPRTPRSPWYRSLRRRPGTLTPPRFSR